MDDWKVNNKVKYDPKKLGDFDYRDKEGEENETDTKADMQERLKK